jgi:hypothetical protein
MSVLHEHDNLIAGVMIPRYKIRVAVANATYARGDALQIDGSAIGAQSTTASKFYGIAAEDKTTTAQDNTLAVYLSGQFTGSKVNFGASTQAAVTPIARPFQIYFE